MARQQSRRSVSLNRNVYEAAKEEADRRGLTLAGFVEASLAAAGVPIVEHVQQSPDLARANATRRAARGAARVAAAAKVRRPSPERHLLGDHGADAHGFA